MAMERQNNLLQEKFESLDDLPLDYQPNIESKWELLAAGLHGKKPARKPKLIWYLSGVAALFLAVLTFFWSEPKQIILPTQVVNIIPDKPQQLVLVKPQVIKESALKIKRKAPIKTRVEAPVLVQTKDSVLPNEPSSLLAEVEPVKQQARFTEIDFTDEVYLAKFPVANSEKKLVQFNFFKPQMGGNVNSNTQESTLQFKANF